MLLRLNCIKCKDSIPFHAEDMQRITDIRVSYCNGEPCLICEFCLFPNFSRRKRDMLYDIMRPSTFEAYKEHFPEYWLDIVK